MYTICGESRTGWEILVCCSWLCSGSVLPALVEMSQFEQWENIISLHKPGKQAVEVYVEIICQLDATDVFYCRSYCLLNMFREPLCPSSGAREYYTSGCCLSYLVLGFQVVGMVWRWGLCVRFATMHGQNHIKFISFMSVRPPANPPAWNDSAPTIRIFMKFDVWVVFENLSRKFKFL